MPLAVYGTPSPPISARRTRLDSWKEIANYLGKGERTVKRWESERSLPVRHVPGRGHGSVYAFTAELDEWLLAQKPRGQFPSQENAAAGPEEFRVEASARGPDARPKWRLKARPAQLLRILSLALLLASAVFVSAYFLHHHSSTSISLLSSAPPKTASSADISDTERNLAHELYLRGRFEWNRRTPESLNRALDYFTQAIVHDPGNAEAYVGLADTYDLLREYSTMPENEAYKRAIAAAKKAIELDDSLAEAHRSLAFDEVWGNWDFAAAEREFQRAIELNPRDPLTRLWFANAFAAPGWYPVCLRAIDRAQELDPASHAILADKGLMLFHAGQTQQGLELVRQVAATDPEFLSPHRYLAEMYRTLRDYPNFLRESERAAELSHDDVLKATTAAAKAGFRQDGERGLLQRLYLSQKKFYAEDKLPGTFLAITCAQLGKKEEALHLLREDYARHNAVFLMIRQNLILLTLDHEPGYQELLRKVHSPVPATAAEATH
jgi:tetratricopeptide (TPR) repeat protein